MHWQKRHQTGEIHLFMSYSTVFPIKNFVFAMAHIIYEQIALELWKFVTWRGRIMQIPNMAINLLSEQFLTMNLKWVNQHFIESIKELSTHSGRKHYSHIILTACSGCKKTPHHCRSMTVMCISLHFLHNH